MSKQIQKKGTVAFTNEPLLMRIETTGENKNPITLRSNEISQNEEVSKFLNQILSVKSYIEKIPINENKKIYIETLYSEFDILVSNEEFENHQDLLLTLLSKIVNNEDFEQLKILEEKISRPNHDKFEQNFKDMSIVKFEKALNKFLHSLKNDRIWFSEFLKKSNFDILFDLIYRYYPEVHEYNENSRNINPQIIKECRILKKYVSWKKYEPLKKELEIFSLQDSHFRPIYDFYVHLFLRCEGEPVLFGKFEAKFKNLLSAYMESLKKCIDEYFRRQQTFPSILSK